MIATALLGLVILGVVISWDKQLPRPREGWSSLSVKRRLLTAAGVPVGLGVAGFAGFLIAAGADARGFYESLALLLVVCLGAGGLTLAGLTVYRLVKAQRTNN